MCRWNRRSAHRPLTSPLRSPGSRPAAPRTVLHGLGSTHFWRSHPFGTFPRRNTGHPPQSRQKIPETPGQAGTDPYSSPQHFSRQGAQYSGTGSSRGQDGSRCRLKAHVRPFFRQDGWIYLPVPRRGPGSALRALETVLLPQTWRLVPGYSMPPPRGTDGVPGACLPRSKIPLLPRELLRVPSGNLRGVLLPPASLRSSALMG